MGQHTSQQCCYDDTYNVLLRVLKTQRTAEVSCDLMIMEYILGSCNSRAATAAREYALCYPGRRDPDANVFRLFQLRLRERGSVTSSAHVNAGRPRIVRTPGN
jgi:hypothetical protein